MNDVRGWPERIVTSLGARQAMIVSVDQLVGLGVHRSAIARAVARGRLHRTGYVGVYSLAPAGSLPALAAEHAALLACGPHAVLSHRSALVVWGIAEPIPGPVSVTVIGSDCGRRRSGIDFHSTQTLDRVDVRRHRGLRLTAPARTLVDFAGESSHRQLELAIDRGLVSRLTSRTAIRAAVARCPTRKGAAVVLALLDPTRPISATDSPRAEQLLDLIRSGGLPDPEADVPLGDPHSPIALDRYRPDLMWRRWKVAVEYDGREYHSGRRAVRSDNRRDAAMIKAGWTVIRVRWEDLDERAGRVLVQIAVSLTRNGWAAGRG